MKILIVCLGNICRSPIAEAIMQKMATEAKLNWEIESAGTNGYHIGEAPHKYSQKVCLEKGLDISAQRARRFKTSDFDSFDKIFVLAKDVYLDVGKQARSKKDMEKVLMLSHFLDEGRDEDVVDPWYGGLEGYYPVFLHIERCCSKIIAAYKH